MKFHQRLLKKLKREEERIRECVCVFLILFFQPQKEEKGKERKDKGKEKSGGKMGWGIISKTKYRQRT
jgi:hypothetical protein